MKKIVAAVLSLLLCLAGIALCMWTDMYLKEQHNLPKSVDVHSWDLTGTLGIVFGGGLFVLSIFSIILEDDEDEEPSKTPFVDAAAKRAASSETIFKGR